MSSIFRMLPLIIKQNLGRQVLERTPEPHRITDRADNVVQYDRVMETKLAISYAIAIDTIYRARTTAFGGRALDICCGPGHMSITLAKELKLDELIGVDLSAPMVDIASQNAREKGLHNVSFRTGDATALTDFADGQFDLATMMDAAHHMPTTEVLAQVLREMDRVTAGDGLVVVMDLVRLRTQALTDTYIELLAHDYVERGLPAFKDDFRDSMYAAWTPEEFRAAVPSKTERHWSLVVPRGLPFAQFLIGFPRTRKKPFLKRRSLWGSDQRVPVTKENLPDYGMARLTMAGASVQSLA